MLPRTWACWYLFEILTSIPLGIHSGLGLLNHMVILSFIFSGNWHTVFCNGNTTLDSHRQLIRVPFTLHPHQHLSLVFLVIAILTGVRFICIYLVISDIEHLFIYMLAICMSSLEKSIQVPCPLLKNVLFTFCDWVAWVIYIFWI